MTAATLDRRLAKAITIGQRWRRRSDNTLWTVLQVRRKDRQVIFRNDAGDRCTAFINDLRHSWLFHIPKEQTCPHLWGLPVAEGTKDVVIGFDVGWKRDTTALVPVGILDDARSPAGVAS